MKRRPADSKHEYDVCLSFAGEDRGFVRRVAESLRKSGVRVFFDEYAQVELWGKDLYAHLDDVYQNAARFCVLFASRHYAQRVWTDHERQSAQARAMREHREYLLPVRLDGTSIPGLRPTVGYVDAAHLSPNQVADMVQAKLGKRRPGPFFPPEPNLLFKNARLRSEKARRRLERRARSFFEALRRMSKDERAVVLRVFLNTCTAELPQNVHASLDLVKRLTGFTEGKILRLASGLRSLGLLARIDDHGPDEYMGEMPTLVLEWHDFGSEEEETNATGDAQTAIEAASQGMCEECGHNALLDLDFGQLASVTWRKHVHRPANLRLQPTAAGERKSRRG